MTAAIAERGIGDNRAPLGLDGLPAQLKSAHEDLGKRTDELLAMIANSSPAIVDDAMEGRATDFAAQIAAHVKLTEDAFEAEKRPFLTAGRIVDAFFKNLKDPLVEGRKAVLAKLAAYKEKKLDAERKARAEAERIAREAADEARRIEAERLAIEAAEQFKRREAERLSREAAEKAASEAKTETERAAREAAEQVRRREAELAEKAAAEQAAKQAAADQAKAAELELAAVKAAEAAAAPAVALTQSRGAYGGMSGLRTTVEHEIVDLEAVPRSYLMVNDAAIKAAIKASPKDKDGLPVIRIPGTRIFLKRSATGR